MYQVRSQDFYVIGTSHQHSANTWKHYISVIHQCTFDLLKTCEYSPSCSAWFVWGGQGKDCACELRQDLGEFVSWWSRGSLRPFEAHFSRSSSHMCLLSRVWNSIQELCNRYRLLPGGRGGYEQRTTGRILRRSNWSWSEYLATVFYVFFFSVGNLESSEEQRKPVFEKYRALAKLRISYTHGPPKTCQF